ncbi:NAD+ synthase [Oculatella sp. LEGE 06141]|uniref:NAD+ synthase n=1 Tax=Oculatella sp. LEGE 06141 TaxID=1828648 RepID=UPI00188256A8|nr:NAD+ synthase [Oculatella sp. LEGE 06141]MBE9182319.1 NAD+ synthase [Oculatella sp. LEGE 06141]
MKIAIAQLNPTIGDLAHNAQQILLAARQASAQGVRLLLTPELSLCGYPPRDLLLQPSFIEAMSETLKQLATDLPPQLAVLVGMVEPNPQSSAKGGKPLFNGIALLEDGQIQQIFHKRLLPTYDVFDEDRYFEPGLQSNAFALRVEGSGVVGSSNHASNPLNASASTALNIGVTICEDLWNDEEFWGRRTYAENPIADLAHHGVDLIVNLSASPYSMGKQRIRESMLQHAATRYQQPIMYANQVGGNDDLIFDGSSVAFNRRGEPICRAHAFTTDLVVVEFDETTRDFVLERSPHLAPLPETRDAELWSALVLGVRDYAQKCGFTRVVIGLSGGIDSSLVAAIAAAALGADNILGVLMPSPYTSNDSIQDALHLAKNLGIKTHTLPIGQLMTEYDASLNGLFAGTQPNITEENIQSRIRGNLLMAVSNKFGHLLISTGNKSEMAVGYCTLYGDMNGGLAAIADVPKTRVYSICHWLNETMRSANESASGFVHPSFLLHPASTPVIPLNVLEKPPSAELKPGQTDQDLLPPYDTLDDILDRLIHQHQSLKEIAAAGHDPTLVEQVVKLVSRAEFKRKQAPPGLKVTDRAFGTGWRMPIASRWITQTQLASVSSPDSPPTVALATEG